MYIDHLVSIVRPRLIPIIKVDRSFFQLVLHRSSFRFAFAEERFADRDGRHRRTIEVVGEIHEGEFA